MINQTELEKIEIENKQYLVYHCTKEDETDQTELEMLRQNEIFGVCAFQEKKEEEKNCYYYDVTGMITMEEYVNQCKDRNVLETLCASVKTVLTEAEEYMLFPQHYVAEKEYVMMQEAKPMFVVLPVNCYNQKQSSQAELLQPVLDKIEELKKVEDSVESAEGKTAEISYQAVIIQKSNESRINITKPVFKMGRDGHQVDYVVKNPVVGRLHASLYLENDKLYIVDEESKNGTYVGNERLESGQKTELKKGEVFRLGTEEFTYE